MTENSLTADSASMDLLLEDSLLTGHSLMTSSQYAQVLFHDVSDSYPNDADLICSLVLTDNVDWRIGDHVGLYRVPNVATDEFVAKMDVQQPDNQGVKRQIQLVFKAEVLPKEEDFFQWQYVRNDLSMLGASVPFQLRVPSTDELVAVEDDEFMVVKSSVAAVADQYKERISDAEAKYSRLLQASERLTSDLAEKNDSFVALSQKLESLSELSNENATLKHDLGQVLDDKSRLVEKLHKTLTKIESMQTVIKRTQREQDELRGELVAETQQKALHRQEAELMKKKNEELSVTIETLNKARDKAIEEMKDTMQKLNEMEKKVERLGLELEQEVVEKHKLRTENEELKKTHERLEKALSELEEFLTMETSKKRQDEKIISDQQQSIIAMNSDLTKVKEENEKLRNILAALEEKQSILNGLESTASTKSNKPLNDDVLAKIQELEMGFKSSLMTQSQELSALKEDVERLWGMNRSTCSSSDMSSSKELDSLFIQSRLNASQVSATAEKESERCGSSNSTYRPFISQQSGERQRVREDGDQECSNKSQFIAKDASVQANSREGAAVGSKGAKSSLEESYVAFTKFLDQLPSSLLSAATPFARQQEGKVVAEPVDLCLNKDESEDSNETVKKTIMKGKKENQTVAEENGDLSELAAWATSEAAGGRPEAIEGACYVLSDHGKPTTEELDCPICQETFAREDERLFQMHVNSHLDQEQRCPMCDLPFNKDNQENYERHVQAHFEGEENNTEPFTHINESEETNDSPRDTTKGAPNARPNINSLFSNWMLDID